MTDKRRKVMTPTQIERALRKGTRWECNNQPSLHFMAERISSLKSVVVFGIKLSEMGDALDIEFNSQPSFIEGLEMGGWSSDEVMWDENTNTLHLWWD